MSDLIGILEVELRAGEDALIPLLPLLVLVDGDLGKLLQRTLSSALRHACRVSLTPDCRLGRALEKGVKRDTCEYIA